MTYVPGMKPPITPKQSHNDIHVEIVTNYHTEIDYMTCQMKEQFYARRNISPSLFPAADLSLLVASK